MKQGNIDKRIVKYFLLAAVLVLAVVKFNVLLAFVGKLWKIATPCTGCSYGVCSKHYHEPSGKNIFSGEQK